MANNLDISFELTEKHIKKTCKSGQGPETCRYLILSPNGFSCGKFTELADILNERSEDGEIIAKGDNCNSVLDKIMKIKWLLIDNYFQHKETMPDVNHKGVLGDIVFKKELNDLEFRDQGGYLIASYDISSMEIIDTPKYFKFQGPGGLFMGTIKVFKSLTDCP